MEMIFLDKFLNFLGSTQHGWVYSNFIIWPASQLPIITQQMLFQPLYHSHSLGLKFFLVFFDLFNYEVNYLMSLEDRSLTLFYAIIFCLIGGIGEIVWPLIGKGIWFMIGPSSKKLMALFLLLVIAYCWWFLFA